MNWIFRRRPIKGPVTTTVSGEDTQLGTCLTCGCIIPTIRVERHQKWHAKLDREMKT